jgi:hypothetical protein
MAPISEDFTAETVPVVGTGAGNALSNCWVLQSGASTGFRWETEDANGGNENSLNTGPHFDATSFGSAGGKYLFLETSSGTTGDTAYFTSPDIDISALTNVELRFAYHMYGVDMGDLAVQVNDGSGWTNVWSVAGQQQTAGNDPWLEGNVDLSTYSSPLQIRFGGVKGTSFTSDMALDEIRVQNPPLCPNPSLLGAIPSSTSADLYWSAGDPAATSWDVEFGPQGFTQGTGTINLGVTNDTLNVSGLAPVTTYDFYVREACVSGGSSNWVGPFAFTTLCAPFTAPYTEDFENVPVGFFQDYGNCWTVPATTQPRWESEDASGSNENSTGTGPFFDNTNFGQSGGVYMYLETSGGFGSTGEIVSAQFDVSSLNQPFVEFYYHMYGATMGDLALDVWDANLGWSNDLVIISGEQQTAGSDPWTKIGVPLPAGYNSVVQFRFRGTSTTGFTSDMSFDDFSVMEAPLCPSAVGISASNIGATSADISFTAIGDAYNIEWGPTGYAQGTGTLVTDSNTTVSLTGLTALTTYDVYVQVDCDTNGFSVWEGPITFSTAACDTSSQCNYTVDMIDTFGDGWNSNVFGIEQNGIVVATFGAGFTTGTSFGPETISLCDNFPSSVVVVTMGGFPTEVGFTITNAFGIVEYTKPTGVTYNASTVFHNFTSLCTPPACADPFQLDAFNITANTADLTWNTFGTYAGFNIEWGPAGYAQGTGTTQYSTNDTVSISGLQPLTSYDYYVQMDCSTNGFSGWAGPFTFTTGCAAFPAPYFEDFDNVPIGAFQDYGNCWTTPNLTTPRWESEDASGVNENSLNTGPFYDNTSFGTAGGTYFYLETSGGSLGSTNELITADIDVATLTTPYVEFYYHMYGATMGVLHLDVWTASQGWTDDIVTITGQQQTSGGANWDKTGATLPAGYTGVVRFRFRGERGSSFESDMSIDDFSVIEAPACPDVNSIVAGLIQGTSGEILWNGQGGTNFNVEWGPQGYGQGSGTVIMTTNDSVVITGLSPVTSYDVYIQNDCGVNGTSAWTGPFTFTTTVTCPAPSAVTVAQSTTTAAFSWNPAGASHQNYVFGPAGTNPATGTIMTTQNDTVSVSGLMPSTPYTFWVRDSCGVGDVSTWVGPLDFNTLCVTATMPYLRNFDGANWPPLCWTLGGTQTVVQNSNDYMEANFWGWSTGQALASTEPIAISQDARVKFRWAHLYSATYPFDQMILRMRLANSTQWDTLIDFIGPTFTSPNATNTVPPSDGDFVQEAINLDPAIYTGQDVVFEFVFNTDFGPDVFVDDFIVEELPSCPEPTQVSTVTVGAVDATLSWTSGSTTATQWYIEYGPAGFTPGSGTILPVTTNPATITGLSPATSYEAYVTELCPNGLDTSGFFGAVTFNTLCAPVTAPYLQTFTGTTAGLIGTQPLPLDLPNCWSIGANPAGFRWETEDASGVNENSLNTGPFFDNTTPTTPGGMYVYLETSFGLNGAGVAEMTSPLIVTSSLSVPNLNFYYHMFGAAMGTLSVDIWDQATQTWNVGVWTTTGQQQTAGSDPWLEANVPLGAFGDTIQIRFNGTIGSTFTGDMALDDISVDEAPACPSPNSLGALNTTAFSSDVFWTSGAAGATNWYVEYGAAGFTIGSGTLMSVTNDTASLTGLQPASTYEFYVAELCPNGVDTSNFIGPFGFSTLCAPVTAPYIQTFTGTTPGIVGANPPVDLPNCWSLGAAGPNWQTEDASGVNENSLDTGPFYDNTTPSTTGGMYLYLETSTGASTGPAYVTSPLIVTSSLTVPNLRFFYHMYGATMDTLRVDIYDQATQVWDVGVWSLFGQQQTAGSDPWLDANVPLSNYGDTIQIRFMGKRGTSFTGDMSLDDISVDEAPACPNPFSLSANSITANSAMLTWSAGSAGANSFIIEYGANITQPGTGTIVTSTTDSVMISGLSAASNYCYFVREICPNGMDTSNAVGPYCFSTLCAAVGLPYNTGFTGVAPGLPGTQPVRLELSNCWNLGAGTNAGMRWETEDASGANENSLNTGPFYDATTPGVAGGMYLFMETSSGTLGDTAAVVSIPIDLGAGNADLEFYYHMFGATMGNLVVGINDGNGWVPLDTLIGQQQTAGSDSFALRVIPLTGYTGTVRIKFLGQRGSSFNSDMSIDEISIVTNGNPNCPTPTALMDSAYCTSADISWVSASGTSYIEYGPAGFMPGSGTVMSPATSPTTISGLMLNTSYDYYVYDICGGTDTSFGGLGSFMTPQGPVAAYTFSVNQGTVTFNASGSQGTNQWDWDFGDGTSGSGMMPSHTYLSNGSYSVSLVVTDTSCGVTDTLTQTVTITNIATCPQPSGLTTGAVACDSAVVNFTSISGSSLVQYGPAGFTPGTGTIVVATSPYVITGLNSGTAYEYWVADVCAATSDTSGYTGPVAFTTPTAPLPTISLGTPAISVTLTEAEVDFDASGSQNVSDYSWDFGNGSFGTGPTPTATYLQNGQRFVTLTVTNGCGSADTVFAVNIGGIGIEEEELASSLNVFPNPTQDIVNIVIDNNETKSYSFELIDALGQVISTEEVKDARGRTEVKFDLSNRAQGIYLLRVRTGNAAITRRITRN